MTEKQRLHAEYLSGQVWKNKRIKVLKRDKYICQRCEGWATEVHHKTYKRWGKEKLEDLESLCSDCHKTHHRVEFAHYKRKEPIKVRAIFGYLNDKQKDLLLSEFNISSTEELFSSINYSDNKKIKKRAAEMLGFNSYEY